MFLSAWGHFLLSLSVLLKPFWNASHVRMIHWRTCLAKSCLHLLLPNLLFSVPCACVSVNSSSEKPWFGSCELTSPVPAAKEEWIWLHRGVGGSDFSMAVNCSGQVVARRRLHSIEGKVVALPSLTTVLYCVIWGTEIKLFTGTVCIGFFTAWPSSTAKAVPKCSTIISAKLAV